MVENYPVSTSRGGKKSLIPACHCVDLNTSRLFAKNLSLEQRRKYSVQVGLSTKEMQSCTYKLQPVPCNVIRHLEFNLTRGFAHQSSLTFFYSDLHLENLVCSNALDFCYDVPQEKHINEYLARCIVILKCRKAHEIQYKIK